MSTIKNLINSIFFAQESNFFLLADFYLHIIQKNDLQYSLFKL